MNVTKLELYVDGTRKKKLNEDYVAVYVPKVEKNAKGVRVAVL